jgi:hypothetical protein
MIGKQINPNAPHQAIMSFTCEILERNADGSVMGPPVKRFGKVFTVIGKNLEECTENLNKWMEKLK